MLGRALQTRRVAGPVGGDQHAGPEVAGDRVPRDPLPRPSPWPPRPAARAGARARPRTPLELGHVDPLAGAHLAAVAARRARPDPRRLEQHHVVAALGQVQRRREPGIAAADDADVGIDRAGERRMRRRSRWPWRRSRSRDARTAARRVSPIRCGASGPDQTSALPSTPCATDSDRRRRALRKPIPVSAPAPVSPEQLQARLLYRDALMLILDKPAGLAVHRRPQGRAEPRGSAGRPALRPAASAGAGAPARSRHQRLPRARPPSPGAPSARPPVRHRPGRQDLLGGGRGGAARPRRAGSIWRSARRNQARGWWMKVDPDGLPSVTDYRVLGDARA